MAPVPRRVPPSAALPLGARGVPLIVPHAGVPPLWQATCAVGTVTAAFMCLGGATAFMVSIYMDMARGKGRAHRWMLLNALRRAMLPQVHMPCALMGACAGNLIVHGMPVGAAAPVGMLTGTVLYVLAASE